MTKTYKELVTEHLQRAADTGLTRQQIADKLGLRRGNYVTMLMSPRYPTAMLSPCRIPALSRLCGLTALERLQLLYRRIVEFPNAAVQLSAEMLRMVMASTVEEVERRRLARGVVGRGHGC